MIDAILNYLDRKNDARKERLRVDGYNYAAGQLLRNGDVALAHLQMDISVFDWNSFDHGIEQAMFDYRILVKKIPSYARRNSTNG